MNMKISQRTRTVLWWVAVLALLWGAWTRFGAQGLLLALSALSFWLLLQFTRVMNLMKVLATHPKGHVRDALALHRQVREGMRLIDVSRLTWSLGEPLSEPGAQPEVFRWTDERGASLTCEFVDGRLQRRVLEDAAPGSAQT